MRPTLLALIASVPLLLVIPGCAPDRAIPSRSVPHRLAKDADVTVYVRTASGDFQQQDVHVPAGWWLASPEIVEGTK